MKILEKNLVILLLKKNPYSKEKEDQEQFDGGFTELQEKIQGIDLFNTSININNRKSIGERALSFVIAEAVNKPTREPLLISCFILEQNDDVIAEVAAQNKSDYLSDLLIYRINPDDLPKIKSEVGNQIQKSKQDTIH